jgi:hypothetical protein
MANLKIDLLNNVNNEKYYKELELVRLAHDANTNYEHKVKDMTALLERIAILNGVIGGIEQYFAEPAPQAAPQAVPQAVAAPVHQGQTHGE